MSQGQGPYLRAIKKAENDLREIQKRVNEKLGVKESDTGLAPPNLWDIPADKQRLQEEGALQVARCTKIIKAPELTDSQLAARTAAAAAAGGVQPPPNADEQDKYVINVKQVRALEVLSKCA